MSLYSLQMEKHVLGGLINNPEVFSDIAPFLKEEQFHLPEHRVIFSNIKSAILNQEKLDKVLLAEKIHRLGIKFKNGVDIYEYIDGISYVPITSTATLKAAQEVLKLAVLRGLEDTTNEIQEYIKKTGPTQNLDVTVSAIDAIYGKKIDAVEFDDKPELVFDEIDLLIEETGNNPMDETGLATPFPEFSRLWGGLRDCNLYAIAARPGQGKTTFLNFLAEEVSRLNNCPVLVLDTEMMTKEIKFRQAASLTGVPLWYLETGNWKRNAQYVEKVRSNLKNLSNTRKVYHYHIGNKNVDEVCSIIRRWHMSVVGKGKKCLVIYDYLKVTGETVKENWAEYQIIGQKVDILKKLCEELVCPIFTAIQINRTGENANRAASAIVDDASVIALSDRLQWFATFVAILRRKSADEIDLDTPESGTHKLIPLKTRYQGKDAAGHQDLILRQFPDGTRNYISNYINLSIENFRVEERGSLRDAITRQNQQHRVTDEGSAEQANDTL